MAGRWGCVNWGFQFQGSHRLLGVSTENELLLCCVVVEFEVERKTHGLGLFLGEVKGGTKAPRFFFLVTSPTRERNQGRWR